jgi:hypothetical protein
MVEVGAFDVRRGPVGNREQLFDARPGASALDPGRRSLRTSVTAQGHGLAGRARDRLGEAMRLGVLDVEGPPQPVSHKIKVASRCEGSAAGCRPSQARAARCNSATGCVVGVGVRRLPARAQRGRRGRGRLPPGA